MMPPILSPAVSAKAGIPRPSAASTLGSYKGMPGNSYVSGSLPKLTTRPPKTGGLLLFSAQPVEETFFQGLLNPEYLLRVPVLVMAALVLVVGIQSFFAGKRGKQPAAPDLSEQSNPSAVPDLSAQSNPFKVLETIADLSETPQPYMLVQLSDASKEMRLGNHLDDVVEFVLPEEGEEIVGAGYIKAVEKTVSFDGRGINIWTLQGRIKVSRDSKVVTLADEAGLMAVQSYLAQVFQGFTIEQKTVAPDLSPHKGRGGHLRLIKASTKTTKTPPK